MRMINLFKLMVLGIVGITVACSLAPEMETEMAQRTKDVLDIKQQAPIPTEPVPDDVVRVKDDIWLGDSSNVEFEGQPIPAYLETKDGVTLISNRPITLFEIGTMLNKITSLSVRYAPELETGDSGSKGIRDSADQNEPNLDQLGKQWTESDKMVLNYKGPLSGLLDEVSNRFGIWWKFEKNEVYFYKYITKTFVLYSLPTSPDVSINIGSESDGGSNISQNSSLSDLDLWGQVESTIKSMLGGSSSGGGEDVIVDKGSGTITVTASPSHIRQISKYINEQNDRLSKQVAISVKVFQIEIDNKDDFKFDLSAVFKGGSIKNLTANTITDATKDLLAQNYKDLTMTVSSGKWSVDAAMGALSQAGQTHLVTSGTVTTMNNKPAPIQVTRKQNYLANLSIESTSEGSDTSEVETEVEEVTTGFMMSVLPRILSHGRLMVFFNLTLSDLISLDEYKAGNNTIYAPVTETRGFTQEIAMKSGETLILSGYERTHDKISKEGVGSPDNMIPGGALTAEKNRTIIVIMLTPVVLESPLSPESRMRD